eukprot:COSAG05_NODE_1267_length_5328_cov_2.245554_1_plen_1512_part_01
MRFPAPPEVRELYEALLPHGVYLKIVDMKAGGNISEEVFSWLDHASTFLAVGTKNYAEKTSNPACSYKELMFAQVQGKRIIPLRMISWADQFEHLQAKVIFGSNDLALEWQPSSPMPPNLVPDIVKALDLPLLAQSQAAPEPESPPLPPEGVVEPEPEYEITEERSAAAGGGASSAISPVSQPVGAARRAEAPGMSSRPQWKLLKLSCLSMPIRVDVWVPGDGPEKWALMLQSVPLEATKEDWQAVLNVFRGGRPLYILTTRFQAPSFAGAKGAKARAEAGEYGRLGPGPCFNPNTDNVNSSLEVINQRTSSKEDQKSRDDRWLNVWLHMARVAMASGGVAIRVLDEHQGLSQMQRAEADIADDIGLVVVTGLIIGREGAGTPVSVPAMATTTPTPTTPLTTATATGAAELLEPEPEEELGLARTGSVPHPEPAPEDTFATVDDSYPFRSCLDRPYVQKEIRWARKYKKKIIVIVEKDERKAGYFDFAQAWEKYRGTEWESILNIDAEPYQRDEAYADVMVSKILQKAEDSPPVAAASPAKNSPGSWDCFLSHAQATGGDQTQTTHLRLKGAGKTVWYDNAMLDRSTAAMEEGVKHSRCFVLFLTGDAAAFPHPAATISQGLSPQVELPSSSDTDGSGMHIVIQLAPKLIAPSYQSVAFHLQQLEGCLNGSIKQLAFNWKEEMSGWHVALSDGSDPRRDIEKHLLRKGRWKDQGLRCFMWIGQGCGWEQRAKDEFLPSLERLTKLIQQGDFLAPKMAVVCLKYGAQAAAEALRQAGVQTVLYLETSEFDPNDFTKAIVPALQSLNDGQSEDITQLLKAASVVGGCCQVAAPGRSIQPWTPPPRAQGLSCVQNLVSMPRTNLDQLTNKLLSLRVLACDLALIDPLQAMMKQQQNIRLLPAAGTEMTSARHRALALSICLAARDESRHGFAPLGSTYRVTSAEEVPSAQSCLGGAVLLWLDLEGNKVDMAKLTQEIACLCDSSTDDVHLLLTCDDAFCDDSDSVTSVEALHEKFEFDEFPIGEETGMANIFADELHEEFKLMMSCDTDDADVICLLDVFQPDDVADAIQHQLDDRPIVAVYRGNGNAVLVRICISDVAYLHVMRDRLLQGVFCSDLENTLRDKPRREGRDAVELSISVDKSQFAEKYEHSILNLNELTPHQREKLAECTSALSGEGEIAVHIKAPAGAGKTFLALHFMQSVLQDSDKKQVLFIARNPPLVIFVAKWLAQRERSSSARNRILKRLHVMSHPVDAGPHSVAISSRSGHDCIETAPIAEEAWEHSQAAQYGLVVIDEAHHIFREELLRALVKPFVSAAGRYMLLSDISQSHYDDVQFPKDLREVRLTEVVRSSQRIVAASSQFQLTEGGTNISKCHHDSEGPPLKSFLFDIEIEDAQQRFEIYAMQTTKAIRHVTSDFEGLSLNDRMAILVSHRQPCLIFALNIEREIDLNPLSFVLHPVPLLHFGHHQLLSLQPERTLWQPFLLRLLALLVQTTDQHLFNRCLALACWPESHGLG